MPNNRANFILVECVFAANKTCCFFVIIFATEMQVNWAQNYNVFENKFSIL